MIAALLAVLAMTVIGLLITLAIDRTARGPLLLGLAFLYGSAAASFALLLLSVIHLTWTTLTATSALLTIAIAAWMIARRNAVLSAHEPVLSAEKPVLSAQCSVLSDEGAAPTTEEAPTQDPGRETQDAGCRTQDAARDTQYSALSTQDSPLSPLGTRFHALDLITVILVAGYSAYITVASLWEWDFWAIWGLKARVFLERGGVDWRYLEDRWNEFAHPDYPLLVPLNYDFVGLLNGGWSDRWLGVLFVAWSVALLLIVRALTAEEAPNWVSAAATAAVTIVAMSRYAGMAEGALIAFGASGLLFLRRAMRDDLPPDRRRDWLHGALLLGLAANCKNEGIALLVATAIAVVLSEPRKWRRMLRLWPSVALIVPWTLLRAVHALPTDIVSGGVLGRFFDRAAHIDEVFSILARALVDPWSWFVIVAAFAIVPGAVRRERFIVIATAVQLAFYIATYLVTPHDLKWHIMTSWSRLTRQVQLPITVACVLLLAQFLIRGEDAPHAEARPQQ